MREQIERALLELLTEHQDNDTVNAVLNRHPHPTGHTATYRDGVIVVRDEDDKVTAQFEVTAVTLQCRPQNWHRRQHAD